MADTDEVIDDALNRFEDVMKLVYTSSPSVTFNGDHQMNVDESVYLAAKDVATELIPDEDFEHDVSNKKNFTYLCKDCIPNRAEIMETLLKKWTTYLVCPLPGCRTRLIQVQKSPLTK